MARVTSPSLSNLLIPRPFHMNVDGNKKPSYSSNWERAVAYHHGPTPNVVLFLFSTTGRRPPRPPGPTTACCSQQMLYTLPWAWAWVRTSQLTIGAEIFLKGEGPLDEVMRMAIDGASLAACPEHPATPGHFHTKVLHTNIILWVEFPGVLSFFVDFTPLK